MILYIEHNGLEYEVEVTNYEPRTVEPHGEITKESIEYGVVNISHSNGNCTFDIEDLIAGRPEMDELVLKEYLN